MGLDPHRGAVGSHIDLSSEHVGVLEHVTLAEVRGRRLRGSPFSGGLAQLDEQFD